LSEVEASRPKRPKTGGRKKGTPNKVTGDLRSMVLGALADAGGRKYLAKQAKQNPGPFMALLGKCLPKDITNSDGSLSAAFARLIAEEAGIGPRGDAPVASQEPGARAH
jgi:hypothetical protein